jgi:hypothetical protein
MAAIVRKQDFDKLFKKILEPIKHHLPDGLRKLLEDMNDVDNNPQGKNDRQINSHSLSTKVGMIRNFFYVIPILSFENISFFHG